MIVAVKHNVILSRVSLYFSKPVRSQEPLNFEGFLECPYLEILEFYTKGLIKLDFLDKRFLEKLGEARFLDTLGLKGVFDRE